MKQLSFQFRARIDHGAFESLFKRRLEGEDLKITKALEHNYTNNPKTPEEKRIAKLIFEYREIADQKDRDEIKKQEARFKEAVEKLKSKETKKALNDKRISADKIEKLKNKIERRNSDSLENSDGRIWPKWYFPMILSEGGELVIKPFRYHMRPQGKPENFDQNFDGNYNAREDRLHEVRWWASTYGKQHGIMVVERFYENVPENEYQHRLVRVGEKVKNLVVSFDPGKGRVMLVPMLYDQWRKKGASPVDGAAAITFDPTPEIKAAGHDRCIGRLKPENVNKFLSPENLSPEELNTILYDHEEFHFAAEIAA